MAPTGHLLIANRGEVAIRIARAASELGLRTVAVYAPDDHASLHVRRADEARELPGGYLDGPGLVSVALETGCELVHPGYGFLSESAGFARLCAASALTFVGPTPDTLDVLGDKTRARELATSLGVPVLDAVTDEYPLVVKAVWGGGGKGMRVVEHAGELDEALERCRSEAERAFGSGDVYLERYLPRCRHVEVQVIGDGSGAVGHIWDRECSLQRRHQKLVEIAPAPVRDERLLGWALAMARATDYLGLGTFEFLVDGESAYFIEANPRLQVEHTVTEEITGLDLVQLQIGVVMGDPLPSTPAPRGAAIQLRVNAEGGGVLTRFELPGGPGVRVDTAAHVGHAISPLYDSLLAKVVCRTPSTELDALLARALRALDEFGIDGAPTNLDLLRRLLDHEDVRAGRLHTRFVDDHASELARVAPTDPLAVLVHGTTAMTVKATVGTGVVLAPMQGTIVSISALPGDRVVQGAELVVMDSMKMEHVVPAPVSGVVTGVTVAVGEVVYEGHPLVQIEAGDVDSAVAEAEPAADLEAIRPDLADVLERHGRVADGARSAAVARRRERGGRTARENVEDLCDPGSFVEYGSLVVAAQRRRRPMDELIAQTQADGLVCGIGRVNGDLFGASDARTMVISYDYMVLAGTQGTRGHQKKDRMFDLAERWRLPIVFFTEGGGGRPGDTDGSGVAGLHTMAFHLFAKLSGLVPLVGVNSGRCFAGNAALLGCCDVVIATANSSIGMGGPAMIEGGGLGVFHPDEVGPMSVQVPNGVVDIAVADEAEAVAAAKRYLSYFQGPVAEWTCADQRLLRGIVPENRLRVYDVRRVIDLLADEGSVLELRRGFGAGMVTSLVRVEGRPLGIVANNPTHLAGAIDADGSDKATRFIQLCDAFDLPILFLCDTPGMMVGPESEKTALVRKCCNLFIAGANVTVPTFTIVLRKAYGLGAQAMAGGSFWAPFFAVSWPTGEFGGMGLEGSVKLGFRRELEAIEDPAERLATFERMVESAYERGKALNTATYFEIDDVIDPVDSRRWISLALQSTPHPEPRTGRKRTIDTW